MDIMRNYLKAFAAASAAIVLASCGGDKEKYEPVNPGGGDDKPTTVNWTERAVEMYNTVNSFYQIGAGTAKGLYVEEFGKGSISFLWPYDGMCSAFAALNALGHDVDYANRIERFQAYYRNSAVFNVGGYGSSTNGSTGGGDRFYDDNSIIGIELCEAYRQTKDPKYLTRCAQIVKFLKTGMDDTMGKALWWCESNINQRGNDSSNKPACANGFATWFLLQYYELAPEAEKAELLSMAETLYDWLYKNLRDPEDNVYWNSKQADGSINRTKWTYNSGAMVANGLRLYKATGDISYLNQAKATADGAYNYFVRPRNGLNLSYPTNDPWFTIQLIKAYIELEPNHKNCKNYIEVFVSNLNNAWKNGRDSQGLFYEDWTGKNINPSRDRTLLMQAAAIESLAVVALYKKENK